MKGHAVGCKGYCCSDFRNLNEPLDTDGFQTSLTNDIHEVFDRDMFPGLTSQDYAQLDLPLRLASRMLNDRRVVEYIVTCTDGSLHDDHPRESAPGPELNIAEVMAAEKSSAGPNPPLLRYPRTSPNATDPAPLVSNTTHLRSQEILTSLKLTLKQISIREISDAGTTRTLTKQPLPPQTLKLFPNSCGSKILLTLSYDKTFGFLECPPNSAACLASHYILARILVHEIAHVLNRAVNGWRAEEVFYKNECCNESGSALEQALFGGFVQFRDLGMFSEHGRSEAEQEVVISEGWPTRRMVENYNASGANVQSLGQRWEVEEWVTATRIPWSFIQGMFTDRFWEQVVPTLGEGPIEPSPKVSWLTKVVMAGERYVNSLGESVTATEVTVVTCSPLEELSEQTRLALDAIVDAQDARRRAN